MTIEQNKATVRRVVEEIWNKGNMAVADEVIAPDYVFRVPGGHEYRGPEGLKQIVARERKAFPDLNISIKDLVAEGDTVALDARIHGTFRNEFMGITPTGKEFDFEAATFVHFTGGKEVEATELIDQLSMFHQLGVSVPLH